MSETNKIQKENHLTPTAFSDKRSTNFKTVTSEIDINSSHNPHMILLVALMAILLTLVIALIIVITCVLQKKRKPACHKEIEAVRMPLQGMFISKHLTKYLVSRLLNVPLD